MCLYSVVQWIIIVYAYNQDNYIFKEPYKWLCVLSSSMPLWGKTRCPLCPECLWWGLQMLIHEFETSRGSFSKSTSACFSSGFDVLCTWFWYVIVAMSMSYKYHGHSHDFMQYWSRTLWGCYSLRSGDNVLWVLGSMKYDDYNQEQGAVLQQQVYPVCVQGK